MSGSKDPSCCVEARQSRRIQALSYSLLFLYQTWKSSEEQKKKGQKARSTRLSDSKNITYLIHHCQHTSCHQATQSKERVTEMSSSSSSEAGPSRRTRSAPPCDIDTTRVWLGSTDVANGSGDGEGASQAAASISVVPATTLSFFPTPALDHAFGGIAAGAVATICMNPLDLIKTKYQVDTSRPRPLSFRQRAAAAPLYSQVSSLASGSSAAAPQEADAKGKGRAVEAASSRGSSATGALRQAAPVRHGWRYYALGGKVGNDMVGALSEIVKADGWKGLYRG